MGMNARHLSKYATQMEGRVMAIVNEGIWEQQSQTVILAAVNALLCDMHPQAPGWLASRLMGRATGDMEVVGNFMVISGWSLLKPWRGSMFLRTWSPETRQGAREPKLDWEPPCFRDVQEAGIPFCEFEQEYCDMTGFYWPGPASLLKPFSHHHVTKKVKVTP